nr:uncharacterized protein LOC111775420 isoform X2 [Equus caballus]
MRTEIQTLQQQFQTRSLDQHSSSTRTHVRNEHSEACPRPAEADTRGLGPIGLFEQDSPEDPDAPWSLRTLEHREGLHVVMLYLMLPMSAPASRFIFKVKFPRAVCVEEDSALSSSTGEPHALFSNLVQSPHLLTPDLEEPSTWKVIPVGGGRKAQLVAKARLQAPGSGLQAPGPGSRLQAPGSRLQVQAPGSRLQDPGSRPAVVLPRPARSRCQIFSKARGGRGAGVRGQEAVIRVEVARTHFRSEVSLGIPIYKADESRAARLKLGCAGWGLGKGGQAQQIGLLLALVAASTPSMEPQGARDPSLNITLKASSSLGLIQMQETELPAGSLTLQLPRGLMQASAERVSLAMGAFLVLRPALEDGRWRLSQAPAPSSQGEQPHMAICHPPPKLYGVPAMEEVAKNPQSPVRSQMEPQQVLLRWQKTPQIEESFSTFGSNSTLESQVPSFPERRDWAPPPCKAVRCSRGAH